MNTKKIVSGNNKTFVLALVALILVDVLVVTICVVTSKKKADKPTTEPVMTENFDYEELFKDRNTEESLIKFVVINPDKGSDPAVRSYPKLEDATLVGRIKSGTEIYVSKAFKVEGETENTTWFGVLYDDISGKVEMASNTSYDKIDAKTGIVWVNGYYSDVYCYDKDPGEYDNLDYKKYIRYQGEYTIRIEEACNLHAYPEAGFDNATYGEIQTGSIIETTVVYEDINNLFYGVPASSIKNSMLKNRIGDVKNDPDGIVWFSVDYAGTINPA